MQTKRMRVFVATGVFGLALGTGVGIAAARPHTAVVSPAATTSGSMMGGSMMGGSTGATGMMGATGSMHGGTAGVDMDAMHAAMRDRMPASLRAQCDALHAQMTAGATTNHGAHHPTA